MQHTTHNNKTTPRFFVSVRGRIVDRRTGRDTGWNMLEEAVTRSELQVLADMFNEPAHVAAWDRDGTSPTLGDWYLRLESECRRAA